MLAKKTIFAKKIKRLKMAEINIVKQLQSVKDNKYRDFMAKLVPNIDKSHVMGVRAAEIKNLAKSLKNSPTC